MKKGDKITVAVGSICFGPETLPAPPFRLARYMTHEGDSMQYEFRTKVKRRVQRASVRYTARGIWWAKGWEGEDVEALKVATALL